MFYVSLWLSEPYSVVDDSSLDIPLVHVVDSIPPKESIKTGRWFLEGNEITKQEGVDLYYEYKTACVIEDSPKQAVFKYGEKARNGIAICVWYNKEEK